MHTGLPASRPRVISASKRTDIPAFYLRWFAERCAAGWIDVPNPRLRTAGSPAALTHVSLRPEHVIAIVWWSKNYAVYERMAAAFAQYPVQYFHFTINPRPTAAHPELAWLEPGLPPLAEVLRQARFLAELPGGPACVAWRYDPICFWQRAGQNYHSWDADFFATVCRALSSYGITTCFTSLADRYAKFERRVRRNFPEIALRDPTPEEIAQIAREMAQIAASYGIRLKTCAEPLLANQPGFTPGACIDGGFLGGSTRPATDRQIATRRDCACTLHTDIGDYVQQACRYHCVYCYALPG